MDPIQPDSGPSTKANGPIQARFGSQSVSGRNQKPIYEAHSVKPDGKIGSRPNPTEGEIGAFFFPGPEARTKP
ncbi:hypothetical protein NL676_022375 [Syzygium grande]|nr:hypothetical protein NL676_022375 [Syzygium grande]